VTTGRCEPGRLPRAGRPQRPAERGAGPVLRR